MSTDATVAASGTRPEAELTSAFAAFTSASTRLEAAYGTLEAEVVALKDALATTTAERDAAWQAVRERQLDAVLTRHQRLAALGEMAATLAHQIRTPLSAALLYASNAANAGLAANRRDELLGRAIGCLNNLEQLVSDMLGFARGAAASNAPVALADIAMAITNASPALVRPGQHLNVAPLPASAVVCGSREALVGAVLNLITNALQAAGPNAAVDVDARIDGQMAEIRVTDNGPGVPAALRPRIFDPFFTSRPDGTGLGLAVVRSVAEAHGGDIRLDSQDGAGARFVLRLPLAAGVGQIREHQAA
ncbi:MAG: HAMP domain-containing histidine kinase [Chromatiales bacterium]|nr:HAMP domain-containing histidine kinase [Chromatiales bacterium]